MPSTVSRLGILAAGLLFSTGGAAIKACGLGSWQVACFRSGVAAVALFLLLPAARRGWSWRVWPVGAAYAATMVCYALANKLTTAANTIFLQSTAPLYLLLLAPLLLREPVRRRDLVFMVTVAGGMSLFFVGTEPATAVASDPATGNLLGLASGVFWALTLLGLRWVQREGSTRGGTAAVVAGNALACLFTLPEALPVTGASAVDWLWIVYLGVFQIGLAYLFLTFAVQHVPALETALLLFVEPVLNPVWAWLVHGETPGKWALLGGVIILSATLVKTLVEGRKERPATRPPSAARSGRRRSPRRRGRRRWWGGSR